MKIFSEELVEKAAQACKVADLSRATIGEVLLVAQYLEKETGIPFIRMDQGSPGLPVNQAGVEAEKDNKKLSSLGSDQNPAGKEKKRGAEICQGAIFQAECLKGPQLLCKPLL